MAAYPLTSRRSSKSRPEYRIFDTAREVLALYRNLTHYQTVNTLTALLRVNPEQETAQGTLRIERLRVNRVCWAACFAYNSGT